MKTHIPIQLLASGATTIMLCAGLNAKAQTFGEITPYTNDAYTVLLDHFDGGTDGAILAYATTNGTPCGNPWPAADPDYSSIAGPGGLGLALGLYPPPGNLPISASYLKYPGGELLCQANGTLECWVYLTNYLFSIHQFNYPGECAGDVGGLLVNSQGQLLATIWYTFSSSFSLDSGTNIVPLNTWTHVALSWGSTGARLYLNGVLVGNDPNTGAFAHWSASSSVYCMCSSGAASGGDGGYIDELRISSIQRTSFNLPCETCPPAVDLKMFAGLILNGPIGSNYNVQATSALGPTNWTTLTNVTLLTRPYIYIDYRSPTNPQQFYRVVP